MREFENHVQYLKYSILKALVIQRMAHYHTKEVDSVAFLNIPNQIIPGPDASSRCCIYKERAIVGERMKLMMGHNDKDPILQVIDMACDDCSVAKYVVTDACRGCLAHRCVTSCKFGAIKIINQRAVIDIELCKECGKCEVACPYNAIAEVLRPCIKACPVGAIHIHPETKKASIDEEACILCGACSFQCPFGAIMDKSDLLKILDCIEGHSTKKVYAIIAPAISSQFTYASIEQVVAGIKQLGFHTAVEAAIGADLVAWQETKEVAHSLEELDFVTSSCCPAFVELIKKHVPKALKHLSTSISPMIATAQLIKKTDPEAIVVFIGPCIAKKAEAQLPHARDFVDYVMTFEELQAFLDAKAIDVSQCIGEPLNNASYFGRIFARTGGLSEAVMHVAESLEINKKIQPVIGDGTIACKKTLLLALAKRLEGNFIEGMACVGGCICGPASLSHGPKDAKEVDKYALLSKEKKVSDTIRVVGMIDLHHRS